MSFQIQTEDVITVDSLDEMETVLDDIQTRTESSRPVIATIESPYDCRVDIGLGNSESIVIIWSKWCSGTADTYHVSLAAKAEIGTKWYWLHGSFDSEFDRKHLIPVNLARRVVREFVETGKRSDAIKWLKEHY